MSEEGPGILVVTNACPIARMDVRRVKNYLRLNDYKVVDEARDAEVCIIGTCVVTDQSASMNFQLASTLRDLNPDLRVIFLGCGPKAVPDKFKNWEAFPGYDYIEELFPRRKVSYSEIPLGVSPKIKGILSFLDEESCPDKASKYSAVQKVFERLNEKVAEDFCGEYRLGLFEDKYDWYGILISHGCNFHCSYCLIRKGIGPHRSIPKKEIFAQIEKGYSKGIRKFTLMSSDAASYGTDIDGRHTLKELLDEIFKRFPEARFGTYYFSPLAIERAFDGADLQLYAKHLFHLLVPIQSASERVLKKMNRPRNSEKVKELLLKFRKYYKGLITTELIYGFPGETEEDIQKTAQYLIDAGFDRFRAYRFSPRPGTPLENEKTHENSDAHLEILEKAENVIRTRYLRRMLSTPSWREFVVSKGEMRLRKGNVPPKLAQVLRALKWGDWESKVDTVLMRHDFPDFVARLREGNGAAMQLRLKRNDGLWDELSVDLKEGERAPVLRFLHDVFNDGVTTIVKRRKKATEDGLNFYIDKVDGLGDFLEVTGDDRTLKEFRKSLGIKSCLPPYEKMIYKGDAKEWST